ncbi:MAG: peptidoglycan DD-metalloendopeptidase family protein, partial [Alphaproteobacteria bacterium]|nr:peptidoglycan DD-metalloendopeptidase family protein [Alphaproteobacteria bacterium]
MKSKIIAFLKKRGKKSRSDSSDASDVPIGAEGQQAYENSFEQLDQEMQQTFPELQAGHKHGPKGYFKPKPPQNHLKNANQRNLNHARLLGGLALLGAVALIVVTLVKTSSDEEIEIAIAPTDTLEEVPATPEKLPEIAPEPEVPADTVILGEIKPGDTLANIMTAAGAGQQDTFLASKSFGKVFSTRKLKPGQKTSITLAEGKDGPILKEFVLEPDLKRKVVSTRLEDGSYNTIVEEVPLTKELLVNEGVIESSLYVAAIDKGIPNRVLADLINIFSFDVDFQREIQKGDSFALMYESMQDETGKEIETGDILVAEMTLSGENYRYYRYKGEDDFADYYNEKGQSVRKALLRTPVDGARISSGFGRRKHPILGYSKMHKGTDFAAPRGTPIYAAGDGVVEVAGWNGGFGKYVRIRHNGTYKTAYAHMHNIAKGIGKGKRVRQRQVIGYV